MMRSRLTAELSTFALIAAMVVLLSACSYAWGAASSEPHAFCQSNPNPNAIFVQLPEDLE